jgi:hypothetical protein
MLPLQASHAEASGVRSRLRASVAAAALGAGSFDRTGAPVAAVGAQLAGLAGIDHSWRVVIGCSEDQPFKSFESCFDGGEALVERARPGDVIPPRLRFL